MNKSLLLKPVSKSVPRGCTIEKKYPFPIFKETSEVGASSSNSNQTWKCLIGHLQKDCVVVSDEESMNMLYTMGFFGKGTLSRRALGCHSIDKTARQHMEQGTSDDGGPPLKRAKVLCENFLSFKADPASSPEVTQVSEEHTEPLSEAEKENLQLMFEEAFFLSYGLGCFVVMDRNKPLDLIELWKKFCERSPSKNFPVMYTAYHHFRSKGWVVRSGLKYGIDYVLYKDGPSFYHSTYSVIVKAAKEKDLTEIENSGRLPLTWSFLSGMNRVNSHVGKAIMFAFVIKPELMTDQILTTPLCVSRFKIQEILIKRWVPNTTREK